MTYSPGIPNATDKISLSQQPIKTNFGQLNDLFDVDHVKYDNIAVISRGRHKKVTFDAPLAVDPNQVSPVASLYTKTVAGASELFFQNGNLAANVKQLTGLSVTSVANGGTAGGTINTLITPWGIRIYCGLTFSINGGPFTVIFPTALTTAVYVILATPRNNASARFVSENIQGGNAGIDLITNANTQVDWFVMGKV